MNWKLKDGKEKMCDIRHSPGHLSLQSEKYKGLEVEMRRNEVTSTEIRLGIRLSMFGGDDTEYTHRIFQWEELAGEVISSPFTRRDAEAIFRERWVSLVGYCIPITQFIQKQCDAIQWPFFNAILPKIGSNRHFSHAVVLGPKKYQGKQLMEYSTHQYISHLERFVGYVRMENEIGNLMRIQVDQHQQLMGTDKNFLELDGTKYRYGEPSRIQFLWEQIRNMGCI